MKKNLLLLYILFLIGIVYPQNEKYLPVTTIQEEGPWASGVEVRNISLDSRILDALYTLLTNSSEVDSVIKSSKFVCYTTAYRDKVYFLLSEEKLSSRVLSISRISVKDIGMIKRLDNNMFQAAGFFAKCIQSSKENEIFNIFAGIENRFYYTSLRAQYYRCYLNQSIGNLSSGYLIIPPYATSFGIGVGRHLCDTKMDNWGISISVQDQIIADKFSTEENKNNGFLLRTIFRGDLQSGTYKYSVTFHTCVWCKVGPRDRFKIWFECAGNGMIEPMSIDVNGNPQPFLFSKAVSEIVIPK